jgi:four helix bundle protein
VAVRHYRELIAWQKAMDLTVAAYGVSRALPSDERFGLCTQIQRSAVSVAANIAEGHERKSSKEYRRFLSIASASLAELETHLLLAERLVYIQMAALVEPLAMAAEVGKIIRGIERAVGRALA